MIAAEGLAGGSPVPVTGLLASIPASAQSGQPEQQPIPHVFVRTRPQRPPPHRAAAEPRLRARPATSCGSVVHVGDSTSEGLVSHNYLPDARDRIDAQYARVGATRSRMEIEGATSIVEPPADGTDAYDAASAIAHGRLSAAAG